MKRWGFIKFTKESWHYMKGYSRLKFLLGLIPAWRRFDAAQRGDFAGGL